MTRRSHNSTVCPMTVSLSSVRGHLFPRQLGARQKLKSPELHLIAFRVVQTK